LIQWSILLLASLVLGFGLQTFHIPAALLLGPMIVGVAMGLLGASVRIPGYLFIAAQAVLGCMIAQSLSPAILTPLLDDWPLVLMVLIATLLASGISGWCLVRFSSLPGPTGAWGSSPGGASAMVARIGLGDEAGHGNAALEWFPSLDWRFPATLGVAIVGAWLGPRLRIPSGALLLPMIIGAVLHSSGTMALQVPEWLLALAYTLIGWSVGLRFTRPIFLLALRTLPQMVVSIVALMLFCGLLAWMLTHFLPVDLMTAYLATSPGGLDTVAIIAAGSRVDMSFVMAMQTLRLFTILLTGPAMARFISNHATPAST
jgi:hypothetical protein